MTKIELLRLVPVLVLLVVLCSLATYLLGWLTGVTDVPWWITWPVGAVIGEVLGRVFSPWVLNNDEGR